MSDCRGADWAVSPANRAVYVLAGTPVEIGKRLAAALVAYADRRPELTVVEAAQ